jgi:ubiquinone/menaquinone biosynthesis C-methylase UbiE
MSHTLQRWLHRTVAMNRRIRVLSREIAKTLDGPAQVLDVGSGSGEIAAAICALLPEVSITGLEVLVRERTCLTTVQYDGRRFPFAAGSFDYVLIIDALHHTQEPMPLLAEAVRVARKAVIIKDHNCNGKLQRLLMCCTDWFANRHCGVAVPFNFKSSAEWRRMWQELGTEPDYSITRFGLYPFWTRLYFRSDMDFIARLPVTAGVKPFQ